MSIEKSSSHIKRYKRLLSAVHMVYRLVNSTYNLRELTLRLTRLLCQFIDSSYASVHILNRENNKVELIAVFNNKINILLTKKKELQQITAKEKKISKGFVVFEEHFIGLPLVADDNIGAIFVKREKNKPAFTEADWEMLKVVAEQSVTAIRNIQLSEQQQKIILSSVKFIGQLLERHGHSFATPHTPAYFKIVEALAKKLNVGQEGLDALFYASVLRDAGAVDVPYEILSKRSQLTPQEFKVIQEQPTKCAELIRPVEFLKPVLPIILYRHEKYDGSGYPSGLKKEQIPLGASVMAVVDAFEAMTTERPYKKSLSVDSAIAELKTHSGTQFNPDVVNAFIDLAQQKKIKNYLSFRE
ncbi:MAG: HD domain-containing protein [Candidatus Omnitrophica bacterium]|nr:HD domain-containing protein [Candidatus Omnitrophota bacterium]